MSSSRATARVEVKRYWDAATERARTDGVGPTVTAAARLVGAHAIFPLTRTRRRRRQFDFRGRQLPYALERYNNTWLNERTVEIAIARDFVADRAPQRALEVGNVMSHYGYRGHTVIDKYETIPGVLNFDVADFESEEKFDTILAISTLEHVGWDERPTDAGKTLRAYGRLRAAMSADGAMLVTTPIGHNPHLDRFIREGAFDFPSQTFLKRVSAANEWRQVDADEALGCRYGQPYRNANAIFVGIFP